ncbi:hypothetical protein GCM10010521_74610 [Streptomyces rameus]|uniref:MFS transporter n=1 Tax=Streptomyces rameus TaxID=68261 RepID=A0ABN3VAJ1_9ACTN
MPTGRLAEANAALDVGGHLPAGVLAVTAGYLSDGVGLTAGAAVFGAVLAALAVAGGRTGAAAGTRPGGVCRVTARCRGRAAAGSRWPAGHRRPPGASTATVPPARCQRGRP